MLILKNLKKDYYIKDIKSFVSTTLGRNVPAVAGSFRSLFVEIVIIQLIFPILVFAEPRGTIGNMMDIVLGILNIFVVPALITLATAVFIWGIIQYVLAGGSDTRKKEAKNLIIWGLVGLFVIVAMWGIVKVIGVTFGLSNETIPKDFLRLR